jgi:hypothetical protein
MRNLFDDFARILVLFVLGLGILLAIIIVAAVAFLLYLALFHASPHTGRATYPTALQPLRAWGTLMA